MKAVTAHQALIRQREAARLHVEPVADLKYAYVRAITRAQAKPLIELYEWLGTLGRVTAWYGLFSGRRAVDVANLPASCDVHGDELIGVVGFGPPTGAQARDVCGTEHRAKTICLSRGCCTHWAPRNAASYLIRHACAAASQDRGWRVFVAYADVSAGELGFVYQASNWIYLGCGLGRSRGRPRDRAVTPDGLTYDERELRRHKLKPREARVLGWRVEASAPAKHKYVWIEGTRRERKQLRAALRYQPQPYPKSAAAPAAEADRFRPHPRSPSRFQVAADAVVQVGARCYLVKQAGHVRIEVAGRTIAQVALGDRQGLALAAAHLVDTGAAKQRDVARAFGLTTRTVRRHQRRREGGLDQLGRPDGRPVNDQRDREVVRLLQLGFSRRAVARHLGIDEAAVRRRLRRLVG